MPRKKGDMNATLEKSNTYQCQCYRLWEYKDKTFRCGTWYNCWELEMPRTQSFPSSMRKLLFSFCCLCNGLDQHLYLDILPSIVNICVIVASPPVVLAFRLYYVSSRHSSSDHNQIQLLQSNSTTTLLASTWPPITYEIRRLFVNFLSISCHAPLKFYGVSQRDFGLIFLPNSSTRMGLSPFQKWNTSSGFSWG